MRPSSAPERPSQRPPIAQRLGEIDFTLTNAGRRVIEGALGVVRGDKIVIIVDEARRDLGSALVESAVQIGADARVFELEAFGFRPLRALPDPIRDALERAQASVLLVGCDDRETVLRSEVLSVVRLRQLRHAQMVGISRIGLSAGFSADQARILDTTRSVRMRVRPDSKLRLRTSAGSDLEVKLAPSRRWTEQVGVIRPGRWEHLPPGALSIHPADVSGVFVADASFSGQAGAAAGLITKSPIRFEIDAGTCRSVRCTDLGLQRDVESYLAREYAGARVGSVVLGTNVGLHGPTGEAPCDRCAPGLHLTLGSESDSAIEAPFSTRGDLVIASAMGDVDLDGQLLVRSGRYVVV